jgi:hypothetical protein
MRGLRNYRAVLLPKGNYFHFRHFRKFGKSYIRLVCPHGTSRLPLEEFSWNLMFGYFSKICRENSRFIRIRQEWRVLYMKTNIHFWSYLTQFFLEWEMFQTKLFWGNQNIRFTRMFSDCFLLRKSCRLWNNVEKCYRSGQVTDDNMAHAHCMLDT